MKLFDQTHIELVHGWLCDPDSAEFSALLTTGDYDSSMDLIVTADSLTKGQLVSGWESPEGQTSPDEANIAELKPEEQKKVENGQFQLYISSEKFSLYAS